MAKNNEITTSFNVDISELKKGIQEAQRQIRLANAEFKAASSGMDAWDKSASGIEAKLKQLKTVLENQNKVLDAYQKQLDEIVKAEGENSKGADEMRIKIANQQAAINNTTKDIGEWEKALEHVDDDVEEVGDDLDNTTNGGLNAFAVALGNLAANIITDAISKLKDLAKQTIQVGQDFDTSMSNVAALSGATEEELEQLRQTAKDFGSTTKFSASESADALGYMALAGWDAQTSMDALGGVLDLAAASGMDLAEASDIVTDYMSAFNLEAKDSSKFADMMAYAQANANTTVEGLAGAFKNCAANMNAAGQDVETTTSLLAMMANQGLKGEKAGTALSAVMRDITKEMGAAELRYGSMIEYGTKLGYNATDLGEALKTAGIKQKDFSDAMAQSKGNGEQLMAILGTMAKDGVDVEKTFEKAGYSVSDFTDIMSAITLDSKEFTVSIGDSEIAVTNEAGAMRDLTDILADVEKATAGMEDGEKSAALQAVFTSDSIKGLNLLLNAGVDEAASFEESLRDCEGSAKSMADIMNDNLGGDITALKSKLEGTQIAIYEKFEPALRSGVDALSAMLDGVNNLVAHSGEIVAMFEKLEPLIVGTATALGTFILIANKAKILASLSKALGSVKTAIMGVNAVLAANPIGIVIALIAGLVAAFVVLWNKSEAFRDFWISLWEGIKLMVSDAWDAVKEFFTNAWTTVKTMWNGAAEFFRSVWETITGFFTGAWDFITEKWNALTQIFANVWQGIQDVFATIAQWVNDNVFQPIVAFFEPVVTFFTEAFNIIKELGEGCWIALKAIWSVVSDWFNEHIVKPITKFCTAVCDLVKKLASAAWEGVKAIWSAVSNWFNMNVVQPIQRIFSTLWNGIKSAASAAWEGVKAVWAVVSTWFTTNVSEPVKKVFTGIWDGIKKGASDAWEGIKKVFSTVSDWFKDVFSKAWKAVKDVFSTGGKVFDGIKEGIVDAFKTVVNAIIDGINKVIKIPFEAINNTLEKIKNVEIAGVKPFDKLITRLSIPQIPKLEKGGILERGQIGLLEGNGAEAVVPLENNKKWIAATAAALKSALASEGVLNVHNGVTNNYSFVQNNTSPKALSRLEIYRQTNNQLQFARGV